MSPSDKKASRTTRLGIALPGALAAALFLGVVTFGATGPGFSQAMHVDRPPATAAIDTTMAEQRPEPTPKAFPTVKPEPVHLPVEDPESFPRTPKDPAPEAQNEPNDEPKAAPPEAPKPKAAPTQGPKPKPKPAPVHAGTLALEGWSKESRAKLAWTAYGGTGFEYYKLVRSADATVTWPIGADDVVVGVIADPTTTRWADKPACDIAWSYAVFAVRHGEGGYVTLAASNVVAITTTCPTEPEEEPKPVEGCAMSFELRVKAGIGIKLAWEPCHDATFSAYKVLRSQADGEAELIGVIGDRFATAFLDEEVVGGETWTYRVVAVADDGGTLTVIGGSAALSATAE